MSFDEDMARAIAYGAGKRDEKERIINFLESQVEAHGGIPIHAIAILSKNPETGACPTCGYDCPE